MPSSTAAILSPASADPKTAHNANRPESTSPEISIHFSQSQLALALVIAKSKPDDISINEYCQQLRKRIRAGRGDSSDENRYVDSVDFWKDQYNKIHIEKKALRDQIDQLREQQQQLLNHIAQEDNQGDDLEACLLQNLMAQPHGNLNDRRRKQLADNSESWLKDQENAEASLLSSADEGLIGLYRLVIRIDRQRVKLEMIINDDKNLELDEASNLITQLLVLLENSTSDCCLRLRSVRISDGADQVDQPISILQQLAFQVTIGFQTCFKALDRIFRTIPGRTKKPELVYRMVSFFSKSLDLLQKISNLHSEEEKQRNRRGLQIQCKNAERHDYAAIKYLAAALSSIVSNLEWKVAKPGHSELMEGILYAILQHTGRLLSEAVFLEHVAASTNPGNITQDSPPTDPAIAETEARYIVQILYAAFGGPDSEKRELIAKVLGAKRKELEPLRRVGSLASSTPLTTDLLSSSRKLIQSTLLKSAIGGSNLFSLGLLASPFDNGHPSIEAVKHVKLYSRQWLVEMVWALIGWDMATEDTR